MEWSRRDGVFHDSSVGILVAKILLTGSKRQSQRRQTINMFCVAMKASETGTSKCITWDIAA